MRKSARGRRKMLCLGLSVLLCLVGAGICVPYGCGNDSSNEELSALAVTSSWVKPMDVPYIEPRVGPGPGKLIIKAIVANTSSDITVTDRRVYVNVKDQDSNVVETRNQHIDSLGPGQDCELSFEFAHPSLANFYSDKMSYEFSFK